MVDCVVTSDAACVYSKEAGGRHAVQAQPPKYNKGEKGSRVIDESRKTRKRPIRFRIRVIPWRNSSHISWPVDKTPATIPAWKARQICASFGDCIPAGISLDSYSYTVHNRWQQRACPSSESRSSIAIRNARGTLCTPHRSLVRVRASRSLWD